jgi:type IV secretory pathway VirB10-like protein
MGKMQVVADPLSADTILTDKIGEPFEKRLDLLYGPPHKMVEAPPAADTEEKAADDDDMPKKSTDAADAAKDKSAKDKADAAAAKDKEKAAKDKADSQREQLMRVTSFGRGKGTFFLVDRRTRSVIWSDYEKPKSTSADELNKIAEKVVNQLKHDLKPASEQN